MSTKLKNHFVTERAFFISLFTIAIPIALQNVISLSVNFMDNLMLGSLGDNALAAASLGGQPFFILMIVGFGFSSGGTVLIAQYWGKGNIEVIKKIISMTMRFLLTLSLLVSITCFFFSEQILSLYSTEADVIKAGSEYLQLLSLSFVFFSAASCFLTCLRAVELVRASAAIYSCSFFVNVFFNYMFIFGKFGAPELGVRGAAVGTVLARFSEFVLVILYMYFKEDRLRMRLSDFFKFDKTLLPDYIKHSLPVAGNELIWSVGTSITTLIIGRIGSHFVAANSIASLVFQIASVVSFGLASAACVTCGKAIGGGSTKLEAQKIANTLLVLLFCIGIIGGLFVISLSQIFPSFFDVSEEARTLASQMIILIGCVMPIVAIDTLVIIGILRGGGDTRTALIIDCCAVWCLSIPAGLIFGLWLGFAPIIVYMVMRLDSVFKASAGLIRVLSGKWISNVTRDNL